MWLQWLFLQRKHFVWISVLIVSGARCMLVPRGFWEKYSEPPDFIWVEVWWAPHTEAVLAICRVPGTSEVRDLALMIVWYPPKPKQGQIRTCIPTQDADLRRLQMRTIIPNHAIYCSLEKNDWQAHGFSGSKKVQVSSHSWRHGRGNRAGRTLS